MIEKPVNFYEMYRSLKIYFATTNRNKADEAGKILKDFDIELKMLPGEKREIQSERLEEIAGFSALEIAKTRNVHVITEDSGLFVKALNGFPGPYSAYIFKTIGCRGILDLMEDRIDRGAEFQAVVAYCEPSREPMYFLGVVKGNISREIRGDSGFGFDPVFVPLESDGRTFAQMILNEKNMYSHRARAFRRFGEWFQEFQRSLK